MTLHTPWGLWGLLQIMVKVVNTMSNYVWHWSKPKFINRKYMMQELYESWVDGTCHRHRVCEPWAHRPCKIGGLAVCD